MGGRFLVAKYSFELKKKIVQEHLEGKGGYRYLSEKHSVPRECIRQWIRNYNANGDDGLKRSRKNEAYSFEYKLRMVELYLVSEFSYQEIALQKGINNPGLLVKWVNDFRIAGPDALRPRKKGRKKTMDKTKKDTVIQPAGDLAVDTSAEHVKELEDELLRLRIENAFLKELRRLRLEDEAKMRDLQESSTASEENLN